MCRFEHEMEPINVVETGDGVCITTNDQRVLNQHFLQEAFTAAFHDIRGEVLAGEELNVSRFVAFFRNRLTEQRDKLIAREEGGEQDPQGDGLPPQFDILAHQGEENEHPVRVRVIRHNSVANPEQLNKGG